MIDSPERLRSNDVIKDPGENKGLQEASCRGDDEGMVYLKTWYHNLDIFHSFHHLHVSIFGSLEVLYYLALIGECMRVWISL